VCVQMVCALCWCGGGVIFLILIPDTSGAQKAEGAVAASLRGASPREGQRLKRGEKADTL
jgi:hypothetical protein